MAFNLRNRHFLKLLDFTPQEIKFLLELSVEVLEVRDVVDTLEVPDGLDVHVLQDVVDAEIGRQRATGVPSPLEHADQDQPPGQALIRRHPHLPGPGDGRHRLGTGEERHVRHRAVGTHHHSVW